MLPQLVEALSRSVERWEEQVMHLLRGKDAVVRKRCEELTIARRENDRVGTYALLSLVEGGVH